MKLFKKGVRPQVGVYGGCFYVEGGCTYKLSRRLQLALSSMYDDNPTVGVFEFVVSEIYEPIKTTR